MRGKGTALLICGVVASIGVASRGAVGEELSGVDHSTSRSIGIDATFSSKYIWRGINLVDDPVFQPSLTAPYEGLTLSIWGNMELTNSNDQLGGFTEIDYVAQYTWPLRDLNLSVGVVHYQFPNIGPPTTTEVYGGLSLDAFLAPAVTVYQDVDQADGTYAALSIGHTFEKVWALPHKTVISIDVSGAVGYGSSNFNDLYYGYDEAAFTDALISAGLPITIGDRWILTPSVSYSTLLDGGIRNAIDKDDNVFGGLTVSCSF
jgi:hypothetical protein